MKINIYFIFILVCFIACNSENKKQGNIISPPPPDTTIKYEIRYNGKNFLFNNKAERKRFLDSLNIKDTIVHGLD